MQTRNPFLDDLTKVASGAMGALSGMKDEMEARVRDQIAKILEDGILKSTVTDNMVSKAYYFNLASSYNISQSQGRKLQAFLSINNLLDRTPPQAPATSSTYFTNPVLFDQIGRYYRLGLRFEM